MNMQREQSRAAILATTVTFFAVGVLCGAGLSRLVDGALFQATFFLLLGAALAWASSQTRPTNPGA